MPDPEPSLNTNKRRKLEGHPGSFTSSTPLRFGDEPRRKAVTPTTYIRHDQDPKLLHYLEGHQIVRHGHTPFASGGFCDVFAGDHQLYGKVAMRRPRMTEKGYTLSEMKNFINESEIWKKLSHPNVLQFLGLIQSDGYIWAVSRFADNGCLTVYLKDHPQTERRALVFQLADAISYLHRQSVVHGDIKGSNILISADATVLLCDFGLSKLSDTSTRTALSGAASFRWCAPEILFDEAPKTFASDVYSFGMTVYEILSGNVPFHTVTNDIRLINAIKEGCTPPREPALSESGDSYDALWTVASECWDGDFSNRPTMEAICKRLGKLVTSSYGAVAGKSFVGITEPHSLASSSALAAEAIERGFDHPGVDRLSGNGSNSMIRISNKDSNRTNRTPSMGTSSGLEAMKGGEYLKGTEDEKLISGIPRAHARYNDTSTKPSQPCHPDTRTTLLQYIQKWIDDDSPINPFFWLCGEVGVGKTTVAHTIAKEQDELHQLGASFFFNRDHEQRRDASLFATTFAYQLARFDPKAYKAVVDALRPDPDVVHRGLGEQFLQLIVQPLVKIGVASYRKVVLVVDGLDECSDAAALLEVLPILSRHSLLRLRVLVTSRPHAAIVTKFESARLCHLTNKAHFRDIDSNTLNNDVAVYIEWSLANIASDYQHTLSLPWPSPKQIKALIRLASGLFVLAGAYIRYINDPVVGNPSGQLERILSQTRTLGGSPTAELDALYDLALSDLRRSLSKNDVGFARSLLQLAFLSSRSCTVRWLSDILSRTSADVLSVLRRMSAVIRLPNTLDDHITPFHASFGEYIQDSERCSVAEFLIEPMSAHAEWAIRFLDTFICAVEDGLSVLQYEVPSYIPRVDLLGIASEIPHHLSLASAPAPPELQRAKERFLGHAFQTWLYILSFGYHQGMRFLNIDATGSASGFIFKTAESVDRRLVKSILDHSSIQNISRHRSPPISDRPEVEAFEVNVNRWSSVDRSSTYSGGDTGVQGHAVIFARLLWKWSTLDHSSILPLQGVDFESLQNLSSRVTVYLPPTSHFPALKRDWYPSLFRAFQQNDEEPVKVALEIARAIQYIHELVPDASALIAKLSIEDIVLSKEGRPMISPLFARCRGRVNPSPLGLGSLQRYSSFLDGLSTWDPYKPGPEFFTDTRSATIWRFGCVIYEMITGEPPLERYRDLVVANGLTGDYPTDGPTGRYWKVYRFEPWPMKGCMTGQDYYTESNLTLRRRYQTAVDILLGDLQVCDDIKEVIRACWVIDSEDRPPIQDIVTCLTTIFEARRSQNPETIQIDLEMDDDYDGSDTSSSYAQTDNSV